MKLAFCLFEGDLPPSRAARNPVFGTDFIGNIINKLTFLAGIPAIFPLHKIQLVTRFPILNIPTLSELKPILQSTA